MQFSIEHSGNRIDMTCSIELLHQFLASNGERFSAPFDAAQMDVIPVMRHKREARFNGWAERPMHTFL